MSAQSIGLIDPLPIVRMGVSALLETDPRFSIAWQVATPREGLAKLDDGVPDLLLTEAVFPGNQSVLHLLDDLRAIGCRVPVLTYSCFDERVLASRVLHHGGRGYLMKTRPPGELLAAIGTVLGGHIHLSPEMTEVALNSLSPGGSAAIREDSLPGLTPRELEVLQLVGEGMKTRQIAAALGISGRTVDTHRSRIREKLGLGHDIGLIAFASQWMALHNLDTAGAA